MINLLEFGIMFYCPSVPSGRLNNKDIHYSNHKTLKMKFCLVLVLFLSFSKVFFTIKYVRKQQFNGIPNLLKIKLLYNKGQTLRNGFSYR